MFSENLLQLLEVKLNLKQVQISNVLKMSKEGATIPFIARYRKDVTGHLDEVDVQNIVDSHQNLELVSKRKIFIIEQIRDQNSLTDQLQNKLQTCWDLKELEDIYLPFKPRKETKADKAIKAGLEPLAKIIMSQKDRNPEFTAKKYLSSQVKSVEEALEGARLIIAQWINERQYARNKMRYLFSRRGRISVKVVKGKEDDKYKDYFKIDEVANRVKGYRFLAIQRGVQEGVLKMSITPERSEALETLESIFIKNEGQSADQIRIAVKDAYQRLLKPSLEKEVVNSMKQSADEQAIKMFAENLKQLLLQAPIGKLRVLAIDPGFKSGCKVVCLSELGELLHNETIFPHPPQRKSSEAMAKISRLVETYKIEAIAIGNGTAGRETENLIKKVRFRTDLQVFVVNEAGASIYSASKVGREEFPTSDVTVRGAVSIGRRLMDPLAELVKIDPKSIGVGQYQHDVDQKLLKQELDKVVEHCVNKVGVDLNTASKYLLKYVSGIGETQANNIIEYRNKNGAFRTREELANVSRVGEKSYEQSVGFLRIRNGVNPLDNTGIHPESYPMVQDVCERINVPLPKLIGDKQLINKFDFGPLSVKWGRATTNLIQQELLKPGFDIRKKAKVFQFDSGVSMIESLKVGMELPGLVSNITSFGAFVDIGVKQDGLIHLSNLSNRYVSDPLEVVKLNQELRVKVIEVDVARKRIGLSLKDV